MAASGAVPEGVHVQHEVGDTRPTADAVSPLSKELVIGFVGYAGAGCSTAARRIEVLLLAAGYTVHRLRLSELIQKRAEKTEPIPIGDGPQQGVQRFERATHLQDLGDQLRAEFGNHAVATLGIKEIIHRRGEVGHGEEKHAFLFDSIKHSDEVNLSSESLRLIFSADRGPLREDNKRSPAHWRHAVCRKVPWCGFQTCRHLYGS